VIVIAVKFNEQQEQAVSFYKGACAVIAGAGSGKSTVLIGRIDNLIRKHRVPEKSILAISFTRNTADELKKKLKKMGHTQVNVGTFHSACATILAREGIFFPKEKMIQDWQIEKAFNMGEVKFDIDDIKSFIGYQKNYLRSYIDEFVPKDSEFSEEELRSYFKMYEKYKKANGLHDFEDYLINCLEMLKKNPKKHTYDFVLVDEHQDSNLVQNLLIKELCASGNVFCVFDYRQAIYGFRGGNPEYCMNFDKEWENATVINLDINYRSCSSIVHRANKFIEKYYGDYEYYSDSIPHREDEGNIKILTHVDREAEGTDIVDAIESLLREFEDPKEIAVLYRLNAHSIYVEHELIKRGIDYDITNDGSFFKRKEIAGILAYLKLIINPHDDGAFFDIFSMRNYPLNFFSGKLLEDIKKYAGDNNLSMYEALINMRYPNDWQKDNASSFENHIAKLRLQKDKNISTVVLINNIIKVFQISKYIDDKYKNPEDKSERKESLEILKSFAKSDTPEKFINYVGNTKRKSKDNCVRLMSCHASKGLEFKNVFLIGIENEKFPHSKSDILDEARLFYVGATRAEDNFNVSQIGVNNKFIMEY
jgi:DNA helicase-2/ATP-dependent DNA helicase PcrA